jgi:hypothetical protein
MLGDLEKLIFDGFQTSNAQAGPRRRRWQYFYVPETGHVLPGGITMEVPLAVLNSSTIDATCIVHKNPFKDWSSGPYFSTEPESRGTAAHESGHAVFVLDDEYPTNNHNASVLPHHNSYETQKEAEVYNTNNGWPTTDVEPIQPGWWRPEPAALGCIMFDDGDITMPDFERTCIHRVDWWYRHLTWPWKVFVSFP